MAKFPSKLFFDNKIIFSKEKDARNNNVQIILSFCRLIFFFVFPIKYKLLLVNGILRLKAITTKEKN